MILLGVVRFRQIADEPIFHFKFASLILKIQVVTNFQNAWYHILSTRALTTCIYADPLDFAFSLVTAAVVASLVTNLVG